ncbi:unnamed protein product [Paramecium sonneborni]|uniref:Uncharacterized protein n=1 Tax=Paramecium sonneborni TaxID=65129 RepID=A0A8S1LD87_9CILI|nr:unnamed protein product [Paramecium sonneborni]
MSYHYLFKFLIVGDQDVGKSCIYSQFLHQNYRENYDMTVGIEFGSKTLELENKQIKLQIWDTAGQEIFRSITRQYYRSAIGAILVYDITKRESFQNVQQWIRECQEQGTQDMVLMLVGNKVDLKTQYNIHNIFVVKFPNKKDKNQRMKIIYYLLKQVQRIIQTLTFQQAALKVLKYVESNQHKNEIIGVRTGQAINNISVQSNNSKSGGCC